MVRELNVYQRPLSGAVETMRTYDFKSLLCAIACFVKCFFFFFEKRRYFDRVVTVDGVSTSILILMLKMSSLFI